ncbi:MAG TPA: leucyl aminopeptidase [Bacteroidia bacterium]|nr:leucyl aminopeptidase [Bacteroidia bacterium]HNT81092.1 leucyl aminopeptidase [Bacteroidia bacterium]
MTTTIRIAKELNTKTGIVLLIEDKQKFSASFLSPSELKYAKEQLNNKKTSVVINQYHRQIFLQYFDTKKPSPSKSRETIRQAGNRIYSALKQYGLSEICVASELKSPTALFDFVEGILLSTYSFEKYFTEKKESYQLKKIDVVAKTIKQKDLDELVNLCEAVFLARDLVNEPQNVLTATALARSLSSNGKKAGCKVTVLNKSQIVKLKMGGLLSVNKGSVQPPSFTIMEYKPKSPINKKPLVLVGKGVVYDTGGLSLKPTANSMDYMKCDMAGGAVVGAVLCAVAKNKLPYHVIGLIPATDNRPDGEAYAPGDVITMYNGKTVEVLNTDAEGRLILADALHYSKKYKPEMVSTFATLTGAAAAAIGHYGIVCMGNVDQETNQQLKTAGENVYERLAEMPFWEEYDELLKSDIADIKNIGGAVAGAITAGRFLKFFTDDPFMHFDIAGPSFVKSTDSYRGKNGTAVGVRMMYEFIKNYKSSKKK